MNKFISFLILFFFYSSSFAQVQKQFNGVLSIGASISPGVGADFTVYGYYNDLNGYYTPDSIAVGNEIYDSKCERYSVVSVTSTVGVVVLQVDSIGIASDAPSNGKGVIFEPTESYKYPLISSGLSSTLLACIESYRAILIDEDVASGSGYWSKKDSIVYYDNDVAIGLDTANLSLGLLSKGLHINGQKYAELKFTNQTSGTTTTDGASIYTDSNNDIVLKNNESNGEIRFQTGGSTRVRIEQDGDVGIGVNTPTEKLHVVGNTILAGEVRLDSFANTRDDLVSPVNFLSTDLNGNLQSLPIDSIPSGGSSLWSENGTDIYYNSGNVGIGTVSPASTLEVNDNTSTWSSDTAAVNITSNWSGVGNSYDRIGLKFNLNSTGSNANIVGMDFNYNISGTNSNGFLMRSNLINNGRLGGVTMESITESTETMLTSKNYYSFKNSHLYSGAASTHYNQHIYGFYNDIEVVSQLNTGANSFKPHIYGYYNTLNVPSSTNTTEYGLYLNTVNGGLDDFGVYSVGNVTNYFDGSVGIGLSDPDEDLEVNGNIKLSSSLPYIRFNGNNTAAVFDIKHNNSTKLEFYYNGNRMSYYTPIGTTGQFAFKQYSTGGAADNYPGFSFDGDEDTGMGLYGADQLFLTTGGATRLLANNTGVGIGTTNPIYMLHVASGWIANTTQGIRVKNGDNLTPTYGFVDDGDLGMYRVTTNTLGFAGGAGTNMEIGPTDIKLNDYPNTRNDLVSPVNFLSTDASGNILSLPIDSIPSGGTSLWSEQSSSELYFDSGETQDRIGVGIASAGLGFDVSGIHIHDNSYSEFKLSTNTSGSTLTDGLSFYMDNTNKAGLINKENANLELGTNGAAEVLITTGGEVVLNDYPNTRDDLVSPVNFLGTNAGGKIISLPMDSIPSGGAADGNGIYTGSGSLSANTLVTGGGYDLDLNGLADARFEAMTGQFYISSSQNTSSAIDINTTALGGDIDMDSADDIHITAADDVNIISSTQNINISTQETGDDINIGSNSLSGVDINIGHNNDDDISLSGMDLTNFDASNANIVGINSVSGAIIHYNQTDVPHNIGGIITSGSWTASNRTKINTTNTGTPSTALPTSGSFQLIGDVLTYLNKSASTTHEITGHIDNTASSSINILAGDSAELVWDGTTWWIIRNN